MLQSFRSFTSFRTVHIRPVVRIPYGVSPVYREEVASGGNLAAAHFTQQLQMLACMEQLLSPALGKASFGRNEVGSPRWIEFHPRRPQEFDEPAYSPMSHVFHCPLWMPSVWKPSGWREPWEKDYKDPVRSQAEMREAKAREEALVEQGLKSIAGILRDMPELAAGPVWDIVRGRWPARHSDSCMDRLC